MREEAGKVVTKIYNDLKNKNKTTANIDKELLNIIGEILKEVS